MRFRSSQDGIQGTLSRLVCKRNKFNITGSKTGYLDEAGYCLMTRVTNSENLIVVTMGAKTRDESFFETMNLIRYGKRKLAGLID